MKSLSITVEGYKIIVSYSKNSEIPEILSFEGRRISSLIDRDIVLPQFDFRVWDDVRKITRTQHL